MSDLAVSKALHDLTCAREDLKLAKRYSRMLVGGSAVSGVVTVFSIGLCWLLSGYFATMASFGFAMALVFLFWAAYVKADKIEPARIQVRKCDWSYQQALINPTPAELEAMRLTTLPEPEVITRPAITSGRSPEAQERVDIQYLSDHERRYYKIYRDAGWTHKDALEQAENH